MSVKNQKIIRGIIITICVAVVILNYSFAMAGFPSCKGIKDTHCASAQLDDPYQCTTYVKKNAGWTVGKLGTKLEDKIARINCWKPDIGGRNSVIVMSFGKTGHVGLVSKVQGETITITDRNFCCDGAPNEYDVSVNDSRILGFIVRDKEVNCRSPESYQNNTTDMSEIPQEDEHQQLQERSKPYRAIVNSATGNDRKAIAGIYLTVPYEYECDMETIDKEINKYDDFIKMYPKSTFVIEALTNIALLELYSLQCFIPDKDKIVRLEKAKSCYKKIYTNHDDKNWGRTAKKLYDILLTNKNRMEGIGNSKISELHEVLKKQIPLCANPY